LYLEAANINTLVYTPLNIKDSYSMERRKYMLQALGDTSMCDGSDLTQPPKLELAPGMYNPQMRDHLQMYRI
jgi:hypothetical protein